MLVTVSSVRGSPGATSWALLLTAAWPVEEPIERVMLEADCSGGVLGARYRLGVEPGVVTLVSACRRADTEPDPSDHGRLLAERVWAVPGPEVAERALPVWRSGAADVAAALTSSPSVWIADLGRAGPDVPTRALADGASVNVVITGNAVEDLVQIRSRVEALSATTPTVVVLVGRPGYGEDDLHRSLGGRALFVVPEVENLPHLAIRATTGGRARRSSVWRAAVEVAADLASMTRPRRSANALDVRRMSSDERHGGVGVGPDGASADPGHVESATIDQRWPPPAAPGPSPAIRAATGDVDPHRSGER